MNAFLTGLLRHVQTYVRDFQHIAAAHAVPGAITQSSAKATLMPAAIRSRRRILPSAPEPGDVKNFY